MQSYQAHNTWGGVRDCGSFLLDVGGEFGLDQTSVTWVGEKRPSTEELDLLIEETWKEETPGENCKLFDGALCRLVDCSSEEGRLSLSLGPVSFKEFFGTNLKNPHIRHSHGIHVLADALGVSAAVVTGDGFLLLGRRSDAVAFHKGMIHPIGGMVEPPTAPATAPSPFGSMLRELVCLGLVRDKRIVQPELIFDVTVETDVEAVRTALVGAIDANEHSELVPICNHPGAIVSFIERNCEELTPVAMATLLLHGLRSWGSGWFTAARGYLKTVV